MITLGKMAVLPGSPFACAYDRDKTPYVPVLRWTGDHKDRSDSFFIGQKGFWGDKFVCHEKYLSSDLKTAYEATLNGTRITYHSVQGVSDYWGGTRLAWYIQCDIGETICITWSGPSLVGSIFKQGEYAIEARVNHCVINPDVENEWFIDEFVLQFRYDGGIIIYTARSPHPNPEILNHLYIAPYGKGGDRIDWKEFWHEVNYLVANMQDRIITWCKSTRPVDRVLVEPQVGFVPHEREVLMGHDFLFNETSFGTELPQIQNIGPYMILKEASFKAALDNMPKLNDNSISNALEIVSFMKSLVFDHKIEIPTSLKGLIDDTWLGYRYSYSTTMMDAEEAVRYICRRMSSKMNEQSSPRWLPSYGSASYTLHGIPITMKCRVEFNDSTFHEYANAWDALYEYGLQPNFYVIWDMIPYSFIVDWALPIGDIASAMDASAHLPSIKCKLRQPCYSLTYISEKDDYAIRHYTRFTGSIPDFLIGSVFASSSTSTRTKLKRLADTVTLFT